MEKLARYLDIWLDGKRVRGIKVTPYQIALLRSICVEIRKGGKPLFFDSDVRRILDKCGIKTRRYDEVNWIAEE